MTCAEFAGLIHEWPEGQSEPEKYVLTTLPADTALERLVAVTKMRWRIERDYQDLKQEFGLAHYEGRGWRGFHHHATLCIAAYGFLVAERLRHKDTKKKRLIRPATCLTRKLHAAGQFDAPSGTFPIRSRHYGGTSLRRWPIAFSDAHAAHRKEWEIDSSF